MVYNMSAWTEHATAYYNAQKAGNPNYMFKHALKDAAKTYKKGHSKTEAKQQKKNKKNKRGGTMKNKKRK